jgi:hypothetical protein
MKRLVTIAAACALVSCASVMTVHVTPTERTYDVLDDGARKLGWRSERWASELVVYPPGQREMQLWTNPNNGVLELSCNPGPRDECKRLFNAMSREAGMAVRAD